MFAFNKTDLRDLSNLEEEERQQFEEFFKKNSEIEKVFLTAKD